MPVGLASAGAAATTPLPDDTWAGGSLRDMHGRTAFHHAYGSSSAALRQWAELHGQHHVRMV